MSYANLEPDYPMYAVSQMPTYRTQRPAGSLPSMPPLAPHAVSPPGPSSSSVAGPAFLAVLLFVLLAPILSGCSNQYAQETAKRVAAIERQLDELGRRIDSGALSNVRLIGTYAGELARMKPAFQEVAMTLRADATTKGPLYQGLRQRLSKVNRAPGNKQELAAAWQELDALEAGSDPVIYNDALLDVVNTLADLSQGELPRINVPENEQTATVKGGQVPGSYLVGNPAYGQWKTNSSGHSFWEWYGMYRVFTDVLGFAGGGFYRGHIYHDTWYNRPRHSFYHDAGRNTYGSRTDRNHWRQGQERMTRKGIAPAKPKNYGSVAGKRRVSTYAYRRSNARSGHRSRRTSGTTNTRAATKRRSSFFGASSRGTNTRYRGGK